MSSIKKNLINILIIIGTYLGLFIINNLRNIFNVIIGNSKLLIFISIPMIISMIIFLFYLFKIKKKNKCLNFVLCIMLLFYNVCNGILYSANINTFFLLYIILLIFAFAIYIKLDNFSFSLIIVFSTMIIITMIFGMFGLLKAIKYLIPLATIIEIIYLYKQRKNINLPKKIDAFISKELVVFTILFIIAIIGGIGRFVHTYDEYSHWAFDAKSVIYYDKLSTSQEIMSQTRSYAPIITCWHYIIAQYSEFSESNLYIGLSIFVSIFLLASISINSKKNNFYIFALMAYLSCFIFGGVYSFDSLYADLAFGVVFGASFISYFKSKYDKKYNYVLSVLLIILTLIKPSGCIASFAILFYIMVDNIFIMSKGKIIKKIIDFVKKYWKMILVVILTFILWRGYVFICDNYNTPHYNAIIIPDGLKSDLSQKLNIDFITGFVSKIIYSMNDNLINGIININTYQFVLIIMIVLLILVNINNKKKKYIIPAIVTYLIYFILTALSIFISLSYYEASIIASFGRYLNSIHVAIILSIIYLMGNNEKEKNIKKLSYSLLIVLLLSCSFTKIFYFILDVPERNKTHQISNERNDKFEYVKNMTEDDCKIYVLDQQDKDGIMAMWYARYYLFPRKVNASSNAIGWKILTTKNEWDLQDWGLTAKKLKEHLSKYKFDYLYLYTSDEELYILLNKEFNNNNELTKKDLYNVKNGKLEEIK